MTSSTAADEENGRYFRQQCEEEGGYHSALDVFAVLGLPADDPFLTQYVIAGLVPC